MTRETLIEDAISNYWNVRDELKGKPLVELREAQDNATLPFAVCAINITGDLNLGMMMRTACLTGAERFIIYGKHGYDRRTTVGAHNYIYIVKAGSIDRGGSLEVNYDEFFSTMESFDYVPVFIETGGKPLNYFEPYWSIPKGKKPCLVFGNEGIGIDKTLLEGQTYVYTVPQRGVLRSYNVSSAAAIAMYHTSYSLAHHYD